MATIERDFGLKADEQGFLLGVKKLGQDVASIDTNVSRIIDILSHAPVQDFKDIIQQSQLSSDVAKIAVSSTALLEENKKLVTLLSSRTMGRGKAKKPPTEEPIIVSSDTPPTIEPPNGQPPTEPPAPVQEPPSSGDTAPPVVDLNHPNRPPQSPPSVQPPSPTEQSPNGNPTIEPPNGQPPTEPPAPVQEPPSSGDTAPPVVDLNHPNRPPQGAGQNTGQNLPPTGQPPQNDDNNSGERQRDSRGRFVGSGEDEKKGFLGKIVQAIKSGFSGDSTNIDPSIEAMREVGQVLAPIGKVGKVMFKGAAWLFKRRRTQLPPDRDEERRQTRIEKLLKRIRDVLSRGGANGGAGGGLGAGLAGGLLGVLLSRGGGLLKGAGGLLLRAVLSPVTLLAGAFFGGYKLGEIIAPKISEWTDSLIKADIPKRISNAWDTFTGGLSDYFKEKINNIKENTKEVVNDAKDTVGSVGDFAAYQTDKMLATVGATKAIREAAQELLDQRDRGVLGFTPQNY